MNVAVPYIRLYPRVSSLSIPTGYLLEGIHGSIIPSMDKFEIRRKRVAELIERDFNGVIAKFAKKIEREPSYVGRMLYEPGKKGRKNISDKLIDVIETKCKLPAGWLDTLDKDEGLLGIELLWKRLSPKDKSLTLSMVEKMAEQSQTPKVDPLGDFNATGQLRNGGLVCDEEIPKKRREQ